MIISKCIDEKHIYTAWRENGERKFKLEAHEPYFFIEDDEFEFESYTVKKYISRSFKYEKGDWVSLQGKPLKKLLLNKQRTFTRLVKCGIKPMKQMFLIILDMQ